MGVVTVASCGQRRLLGGFRISFVLRSQDQSRIYPFFYLPSSLI